ncbi:MAG: PAS domain S-box protein [Deltaproteobacteria bacterium]|nr:PAS domain S-box protein [Deltaproteobacteria bacterium]
MKNNLFYKIFGTYIIITLVVMVAVGVYATRQIKVRLMERIEGELTSYARIISLGFSESEVKDTIERLSTLSDTRITWIDAGGVALADSREEASNMDNHLNRPEIQEARVRGQGRSVRFSTTLGIDTLYLALPVREGPDIRGYIRLARPLVEVRQSARDINILVLQSFLIVGALSFLIAFIFTSRLVSPIQEMEQFTKRLRNGEETGSLMIASGDETGRLARNINYLVAELKEKIQFADEEKGKLEAVFSSMEDGILVLDTEGRIEATNDAACKIFDLDLEGMIGKTPLEAFRNISLQQALDRFKESSIALSREIEQGPRVLDVIISPVQGLPPGEEKTMIVLRDVTRLKRLEQIRADFVANVTHEIKTPLTAILGFIETLREGAIDEKETAKGFLKTIQSHAERLNRLVDDLLVISDAELGEMRFSFESVSLDDIIEDVLSVIEPEALKKDIRIENDMPSDLPSIRGDRDRLHQIVLNVLDNAVKFTPEAGTILIEGIDGKDGTISVRVSDTGIGIPREEIPRLGERFYRVDKTRSRELGGTGLGLSIVRHLMAAHNGRMTIESRVGRGTTVSLSFPVFIEDITA